MPTYTSQYPPAQSDTYVKSTSKYDTDFWAYFATDPAKSLTGGWTGNAWLSSGIIKTNQRFHIDLGSSKIIKRIYYENVHDSGGATTFGANNYTLWGSNNAAAFAELTYGTDTNWTELTVAQNTFDEHVGADQVDPKYIVVTNSTAYRYYAFKFADNYGGAWMGVRRIELQTEDEVIALISTATIAISTASTLSRGITASLISTANITSSITGRLTKIIDLISTSAITTSITSTLSRGITEALTSTANMAISATASLSRGIKEVLTSTANVTTSITSTLSRGITQALTSTVNITTSILARLKYDWWEESKPTIDWTEETKTEIDWGEETKSEITWTEEEK